MPFLHSDMAQVVEIRPHVKQELIHSAQSKSCADVLATQGANSSHLVLEALRLFRNRVVVLLQIYYNAF